MFGGRIGRKEGPSCNTDGIQWHRTDGAEPILHSDGQDQAMAGRPFGEIIRAWRHRLAATYRSDWAHPSRDISGTRRHTDGANGPDRRSTQRFD
jgi:hypothetical protein